MDNRDIQQVTLMKLQNRTQKNRRDAALRFPASKQTTNPRVGDFGVSVRIDSDRQRFPLTTDVKQVQNVVEDRMQGKL